MRFFMEMNPPTTTAQMKKLNTRGRRPVYYEPANVKAAKKKLMDGLSGNIPETPLSGALSFKAVWIFPRGRSHKEGEWRITRPDTDNINKMLKDCMTKSGFWKDDAQVVKEEIQKRWSSGPCGIEITITELEEIYVPEQ